MNDTSKSIRQRRWLWGSIECRFVEEDVLFVRVGTAGSFTENLVDLSLFDPHSLRVRRRALPSLVAFLILGLGCLSGAAGFLLAADPYGDAGLTLITMAIVLVIPALMCGYKWRREACDLLVFRSHGGDLVLLHQRPDPATFDGFVQELERRIERVASPSRRLGEVDVSREIEKLADLRARGILDEHEFASAKQRLLALLGGGEPMGFARQ